MYTLYGTKLWLVTVALLLGLLLSTLETSIIATALIPIAESLGDFDQSNWVVVAYLITYTSFLVIYARLSDIFGRKWSLLVTLSIFTLFSLACGLANTMFQLIIFRALQGIGGSGIYSLVMVCIPEIAPPKYFGVINGILSGVFASSSILGPVIGGVITSNTTWRWVFLLNVPAGAAVIVLVFIVLPNDIKAIGNKVQRLKSVDFPGFVLLLGAAILIIFPMESGGTEYAWTSGIIIATFVVGGLFWIGFVGWEGWLGGAKAKSITSMLPVFPLRLAKQRVVGTALLSAFLTGYPFMTMIINLPQRFQIANGLSPVDAGIRMLPLLLLSALGSMISGGICAKKNVACYILVFSTALQILGAGLMSTLPTDGNTSIEAAQYGYQVILGLGFGMSLTCYAVICRVEVTPADLAVTLGGVTQVRALGGVIGIAASEIILKQKLDRDLAGTGIDSSISSSPAQIANLAPDQQTLVRGAYAAGFNEQTRIVLIVAAAAFIVSFGTLRRHPPPIVAIPKPGEEPISDESESDQSPDATDRKLDDEFAAEAGLAPRDEKRASMDKSGQRFSLLHDSWHVSDDFASEMRRAMPAASVRSGAARGVTRPHGRRVDQLAPPDALEMSDRLHAPRRPRADRNQSSLASWATMALIASTPWESAIPQEYAESIASGRASNRNSRVRMEGYTPPEPRTRTADTAKRSSTVSNRASFVDPSAPDAQTAGNNTRGGVQVWNMFWHNHNNRNSVISNLSGSQIAEEPEHAEHSPPPAYSSNRPSVSQEGRGTAGQRRTSPASSSEYRSSAERSRSRSHARSGSFLELDNDGEADAGGPSSPPQRRARSASARSAVAAHRRSGSMFANQPLPVVPASPVRAAHERGALSSYFSPGAPAANGAPQADARAAPRSGVQFAEADSNARTNRHARQ